MRFVATGCGHSGTRYLADLITAVGAPCGHEAVFDHDRATSGSEARWGDLEGDSSLAVVGYLDRLPRRTRMLHVVRPIEPTLRSFLGARVFASTCDCHEPGEHEAAPFVRWMAGEILGLLDDPDEVVRAVTWIGAHAAAVVDRAPVWRIDYRTVDLASMTTPTIAAPLLSWLIGRRVEVDVVEQAIVAITVDGFPNRHVNPPRTDIDVDAEVARILGQEP